MLEKRESFLESFGELSLYSLEIQKLDKIDSFSENQILDWQKEIQTHQDFQSNFFSINIEDLLQYAGGFGKYQKVITFYTFLFFYFNNMFFYAIAYWYYTPDFLCPIDGVYQKCSKKIACQGDYKLDIQRTSIITVFHQECTNYEEKSVQMIFLSIAILSFVTNIMGDIIGRQKVLLFWNFFGFALGGLIGTFGFELWHFTVANFLILNACNCGFTFALTIQSESLPNKQRESLGLVNSVFFAMGGLCFCLSQYYFTSYKIIYYICLVFQFFILPYCLWIKETLYFLQEEGDFRNTLETLLYIHNFNKRENLLKIKREFLITVDPDILLKKTKKIQFRKSSQNLLKQFIQSLDWYFAKTLFFVVFLSSHLEGLEQYIPIILQYLGIENINLNGTMIAIAELIGCIITVAFCQGKKRLSVFRVCIFCQVILCFLIYGISQVNFHKQILTLACVCFIRIVNSFGYFVFMVYLVEIFETKNRMIGVAISQAANFMILPLWMVFKSYLQSENLNPIYALVPFGILGLMSTLFLKETLGMELNQFQKVIVALFNLWCISSIQSKESDEEQMFFHSPHNLYCIKSQQQSIKAIQDARITGEVENTVIIKIYEDSVAIYIVKEILNDQENQEIKSFDDLVAFVDKNIDQNPSQYQKKIWKVIQTNDLKYVGIFRQIDVNNADERLIEEINGESLCFYQSNYKVQFERVFLEKKEDSLVIEYLDYMAKNIFTGIEFDLIENMTKAINQGKNIQIKVEKEINYEINILVNFIDTDYLKNKKIKFINIYHLLSNYSSTPHLVPVNLFNKHIIVNEKFSRVYAFYRTGQDGYDDVINCVVYDKHMDNLEYSLVQAEKEGNQLKVKKYNLPFHDVDYISSQQLKIVNLEKINKKKVVLYGEWTNYAYLLYKVQNLTGNKEEEQSQLEEQSEQEEDIYSAFGSMELGKYMQYNQDINENKLGALIFIEQEDHFYPINLEDNVNFEDLHDTDERVVINYSQKDTKEINEEKEKQFPQMFFKDQKSKSHTYDLENLSEDVKFKKHKSQTSISTNSKTNSMLSDKSNFRIRI